VLPASVQKYTQPLPYNQKCQFPPKAGSSSHFELTHALRQITSLVSLFSDMLSLQPVFLFGHNTRTARLYNPEAMYALHSHKPDTISVLLVIVRLINFTSTALNPFHITITIHVSTNIGHLQM
jgi:hypothetical protein